MATCASCKAEVSPGTRWCGLCRSHTVDPQVGRLASPIKRLAANVLDLVVPVVALVTFSALGGAGAATGTEAGSAVGGLLSLALALAYVVWALVLFSNGMTPGKKLLNLRVVKEDGRTAGFGTMFVREWIGKFISGLILSLGFLWILFDKENQGWHDKLMSTYVVT